MLTYRKVRFSEMPRPFFDEEPPYFDDVPLEEQFSRARRDNRISKQRKIAKLRPRRYCLDDPPTSCKHLTDDQLDCCGSPVLLSKPELESAKVKALASSAVDAHNKFYRKNLVALNVERAYKSFFSVKMFCLIFNIMDNEKNEKMLVQADIEEDHLDPSDLVPVYIPPVEIKEKDQQDEKKLAVSETTKEERPYRSFFDANSATDEVVISVIVQVNRIWKVLDFTNPLISFLDFILTDSSGGQVHGSVKTGLYRNFVTTIKEGKIFDLKDFSLKETTRECYCGVNHRYTIDIKKTTVMHVVEYDGDFPNPGCNRLLSKDGHDGLLRDVIGILNKVEDIEIIQGKEKRDLTIKSENGMTARITFWGDQIHKLPSVLEVYKRAKVLVRSAILKKELSYEWYLESTCSTDVCVEELKQPEPNAPRRKKPVQKSSVADTQLRVMQDIRFRRAGYLIDVRGILNKVEDIEIMEGEEQRNLTIKDPEGKTVKITFWGDHIYKIPEALVTLQGEHLNKRGTETEQLIKIDVVSTILHIRETKIAGGTCLESTCSTMVHFKTEPVGTICSSSTTHDTCTVD